MQMEIRNIHESYEFDLYDYLIFVGSNQACKQRIFSLLERYFASANYNEMEEEYFGDNGIEVSIEGKKIKVNSCLSLSLSSLDDLLLQFKLTKKSLLYSSLCGLGQDLEISQQMVHINDELLKLEAMIEDKQSCISKNIGYQIYDLTFEDIIGKLITISHIQNNREIPSYLVEGEDIIDGYLRLVERYLSFTGKPVWIAINNPESFLTKRGIDKLILGLKRMAKMTKQLYFFVFHKKNPEWYSSEDISHVVICARQVQQLPDIEIVQQSIERNYPGNRVFEQNDLVDALYRICGEIGKKSFGGISNLNRDLVLLKVLNELFEEEVQFEISDSELSAMEVTFLLNNN